MASVADQIVRALAASGVRRLHAAEGRTGLDDAVDGHPAVRWQRVGREESASFGAAGDAAMTGELAVCVSRLGPFDDRLLDGLVDAQLSGLPVLAVAIRSGSEAEGAPLADLRAFRLFAERLARPDDIQRMVAAATRAAVEECGVAVIVVEEAMLAKHCDVGRPTAIAASRPVVRPREPDLAAAARILAGARRVAIVAGAGAAGAQHEVALLAETLRAPVAHTLRGKEHVEGGPFDVGMVGPLASGWADDAVAVSDVVLLVGTDLRYRGAQGDDTTVVQIDVRGSHLGRRCAVDLGLTGTVLDTLRALQPRLERRFDSSHLDYAVDGYATARRADDARALDHQNSAAASVAALVSRLAEPDAVFAVDTGAEELSATRHLRMNGERRLIGSFSHGSARGALPLAVGAQSAHLDRQVIALLGERGRAHLAEELPAIARGGLPVKIATVDAGGDSGIVAQAAGLGIRGIRADAAGLADAVAEALDYDGPALVEFVPRPAP